MAATRAPETLLIITQKVDKNDDVLGFFHRWLEEFGKHLTPVEVICLFEGEHDFISDDQGDRKIQRYKNVTVHSLGKERGNSKASQLWRFWKLAWQLRDVDRVFVHMNPIYVILGGWLWRLTGKKLYLWYNHPTGTLIARLAVMLATSVFCTSPLSFASQFRKCRVMPAGIDTDVFRPGSAERKIGRSILCLGRISPVKQIDCIVEAAKILDHEQVDFKLQIVGSPVNIGDDEYEAKLKAAVMTVAEKNKIVFSSKIRNHEAPALYNQNEVVVNATTTGSFDKTILEAMACETLVVVSNRSFNAVLPPEFMFQEGNPEDLARKLRAILALSAEAKVMYGSKFRQYVVENHSLSALVEALVSREPYVSRVNLPA